MKNELMQKLEYKLSIIVPARNAEKSIVSCLNSLAPQIIKDTELIIVNNKSTDKTSELCKKYIKDNIRLVDCKNIGLVAARQFGINASKGKYISYVDADDTVEPDYVATILNALNNNDDVDALYFDYYVCDNNPKRKHSTTYLKEGLYSKKQIQAFLIPYMFFRTKGKFLNHSPWNKVFKKEILSDHCCTNNSITNYEDIAYTCECLDHCSSLKYITTPLYNYYINNVESMTANLYNNWNKAIEYCWTRFNNQKIKNQIASLYIRMLASDIEYKLNKGTTPAECYEYLKSNDNGILNMLEEIDSGQMLNFKMKVLQWILDIKHYKLFIWLIKVQA